MKKAILFLLLLMPILVMAQETFTPPPVETGAFVEWFFSSIKTLSGASATVIIAFILTVIIGLFKLTPLEKYWEKLGKWKFVVPLALAAIVEVIINLPKPFAWGSFISSLIAGAFGTGTVAIALREIWVRLFPKKA